MRWLTLMVVLGCGGAEPTDTGCNATQPECGRWCAGGTESFSTPCSAITCTTTCGTAITYERFSPVAVCDQAKAKWLSVLDACGH